MDVRTLQDKLTVQVDEIEKLESELTENERERSSLTAELKKKVEYDKNP